MAARPRRRIIWSRLILAAIPAAAIAIGVRYLLLADMSALLGGAITGAIIGGILAPLGSWYTYPETDSPSDGER